jgi:hypothetical protein
MNKDTEDNEDLKDIATLMRSLRAAIDNKFSPSRERALAQTKLEECGLWLSAANAFGLLAFKEDEG